MKKHKKILAVLMALSCFSAAVPQYTVPVTTQAAVYDQPNTYGWYFNFGFEGTTDGFSARGSASIASSSDTAFVGSSSLYVSNRTSAWQGASYKLGSNFKAGTEYSFSAIVSYLDGYDTDTFHLTLQYDGSDGTTYYDKIATETVTKGQWTQLANKNFKIPEGASNVQIYVETDSSTTSFYVDEVIGAPAGTTINANGNNGGSTNPYQPEYTYPTNIKVNYSTQYHQVQFTWSAVPNAQNYGIAVYLAGKWRIQTQSISGSTTSYVTPKNLTPGMSYKVAIAAKVNGKWDVNNAIRNAVTVTVR